MCGGPFVVGTMAIGEAMPSVVKIGASRVVNDVKLAVKAGADVIVLDGMQGGTAATQQVFIEHAGIPTEKIIVQPNFHDAPPLKARKPNARPNEFLFVGRQSVLPDPPERAFADAHREYFLLLHEEPSGTLYQIKR